MLFRESDYGQFNIAVILPILLGQVFNLVYLSAI